MRKPKNALTYLERLKRLQKATLDKTPPICASGQDEASAGPSRREGGLPSLEERVREIFQLIDNRKRPPGNMLFFVMYDIESNKVRYNVVKYLERKGCTRIQKSIFLADLSSEAYNGIRCELAEIQSLYDNHDSIIICPISTDLLQNMKIIGQNINVDIILKNKSTLFF